MKLGTLVVAVVSMSLPLVVACGGAAQSDLFGSNPDTSTDQNGTDPTPGGGSTSSTSGGSSSSTSSTSSTSGGSTSSTSSTSGGGKSSGGTSGGTSTSSSGGTTYKDPGVWCGQDNNGADVFCTSTQACCASDNGPGGPDLKCESKGIGSCSNGLSIPCDDQADCGSGNVCCGMFEETGHYQSVSCMPSCVSVTQGVRAVRLCDPDAPKDECAAIGKSCQWSQGLPGYHVCK